jgi:hypothetical protein
MHPKGREPTLAAFLFSIKTQSRNTGSRQTRNWKRNAKDGPAHCITAKSA